MRGLGLRSETHEHVEPVTASCCAPPPHVDEPTTARVVLVGNPNVGKSTVFNALTGASQTVGNWPGKTVHVASGTWRIDRRPGRLGYALTDLPGTYSLVPTSPDEELTRDLLTSEAPPDVAVVVVDAANLVRNLYLLSQVLDTGVGVVVALTMLDVARANGEALDPDRLADVLGVPVVAVAHGHPAGGGLAARRRRLPGGADLPVSEASALRQVLREVSGAAGGGVRLDDVARRVGVPVAEVSAMIEFWVRKGVLRAEPLAGGCPDGGCGSCPSGAGGAPGCGSPGPTVGPVAITLGRRPPDRQPL